MTLNDKISTAWSNLGRRKVRTALTSIGVVVGIMTFVTMISLVNGVQLQVRHQFEKIGLDRVVVRPPTEGGFGGAMMLFGAGERTKLITPADVARWRAWPQVQKVVPEVDVPWNVTTVLVLNGQRRPIHIAGGIETIRRGPFTDPPTALAGTIDVPDTPGVMVLSQAILKRVKIAPARYNSLLGTKADIFLEAPRGERKRFTFKIIGISSYTAFTVQVPIADRIAMKSWWFNGVDVLKSDGYDSVLLRTADVSQAKSLVKRLRKEKYAVQSIDAILDAADRIFAVVTAMLAMVSGVTLLVACIGIVNTMIMSIYERTREIGTLKAMGASRGDIRLMFMFEAGLIGLLGGVNGLVLSWLLGRVLNRLAVWYAHHSDLPLPENLFIITPALALSSLVFALFLGIFAGLYPANRAARLDPLLALRHE